jgi:hypothetical protein
MLVIAVHLDVTTQRNRRKAEIRTPETEPEEPWPQADTEPVAVYTKNPSCDHMSEFMHYNEQVYSQERFENAEQVVHVISTTRIQFNEENTPVTQ